jgi:hypothetical protein
MFRKTGTLETKQKKPKLRRNKIVLGFAGALTAAVMGSAGVAAAHPAPRTMYMPTRETCNQQWQKYHFKNGNDCRNYWDNYKHHHPSHHHGHKPGQGGDNNNGYGGNGGGVTVIINNNGGSGNVIVVIINYFKGNG